MKICRLLGTPSVLAFLVTLAAAGCGSNDSVVGIQMGPAQVSHAPRITEPAPDADIRTLARDTAAFGIDLLHAVSPQGNFIASPHSISIALAMVCAGARTNTHDEIATVMHYTLPEPQLHAAFDTIDLALNSRSSAAAAGASQPFTLRVANSAWGQMGNKFLDSYLDLLAAYYGAGLSTVDFARYPEGARQVINGWIRDNTNGMIPELLAPDTFDDSTKLALANAVYFLGSWSSPFQHEKTSGGEFHKLDGSLVSVPLMHGDADHGYAEFYAAGEGWEAAELPYAGKQVSMVVILPQPGQFTSFMTGLDASKLMSILDQLGSSPTVVPVTLPKFKTRFQIDLTTTLQAMGMRTAFRSGGDGADLSGMDGTRELFLASVAHEAMARVDEDGTEAAAASVAVSGRLGKTIASYELIADRPFAFVVRDRPTGAVLFLGQITDPL